MIDIYSVKNVFFDTCILIYFLEGHKIYGYRTKRLFADVEAGIFRGYISTLTLAELLIGPYREKNDFVAEEYYALFHFFPNLDIVDVDSEIAIEAARIRGTYDFSTPDSLLLASAIKSDADMFVTNDRKLTKFVELNIKLLGGKPAG